MPVQRFIALLKGQVKPPLTESIPPTGIKIRVEEHKDDCCPHCQYVFPEKGFPRALNMETILNRTGEPTVYECYECHGRFTDRELPDEVLNEMSSFFADGVRQDHEKRRQWLAANPGWEKKWLP